MKALVTGATGFIGSHIVGRLVARGDSVRALIRVDSDVSYLESLGVERVIGDIADPESLPLALQGVEAVYHAAALVDDWGPWFGFQRVTIDGASNVLEAAARANVVRFLHVSSDAVYAHRYLGQTMTEETPLETRFAWWDYYRRSKLAAELLARRFHAEGRLAVTIVRPGLVLGERDRVTLPGAIAFLKSKSATYLGDGHNRLPYVYAGDLAEGCLLAATAANAAGQTYNLVSDEEVTQRDLFAAAAEERGLTLPKRTTPVPLVHAMALVMELASVLTGRRSRPSLTRMGVTMIGRPYIEDASKAQADLGWTPAVPLREAVRRAVAWARAHKPQPVAG
ncbi:MAG: NAD-dependent epimerase/dehydratase family protein [Dehalococcoidia bacterium]